MPIDGRCQSDFSAVSVSVSNSYPRPGFYNPPRSERERSELEAKARIAQVLARANIFLEQGELPKPGESI